MRCVRWALVLVAVAACERASARLVGVPARLVAGRADTVLVNSRHPTQLPVRVLDSAGHSLPAERVRYEWTSGDAIRVSPEGHVMCRRRLNAEVRASLGDLSTRFVLLCRPVRGFGWYQSGHARPLVPGGPPHVLRLPAVGVDGQPEQALAATVTVADSTIAALRGLSLFPRKVGRTTVEVDLGDCLYRLGVTVSDTVGDTRALLRNGQLFVVSPLRMVEGERRGWRLPRGQYRVAVTMDERASGRLLLGTTAMNCAKMSMLGDQDLNCIALEGASVDVQHPGAGGGRELSGTLLVQRAEVFEPWVGAEFTRRRDEDAPAKPFCPVVR